MAKSNAYKIKVSSYKDTANMWRWQAEAKNHRCIGASSEGYVNLGDLVDNAEQLGAALTAWAKEKRAEAKKASKRTPAKKVSKKKTSKAKKARSTKP
jgi:hypothetical protein